MTIWKYELPILDSQCIEVPPFTTVLSVQAQRDKLVLWAHVNEKATEREHRIVSIYGTGHPCSEPDHTYVGTVQMKEGHLVLHVFVH